MKTTRAMISLLPAAVLLAAACAAPGDLDPMEATNAVDAEHGNTSRAHLMPMPHLVLRKVRSLGNKDESADSWGQSGYNFTYRGGPVISNVKVVTVFWNSTVPNQSNLNSFYQTIVQSPHLDWLSEYKTPTQTIGRGSFLATYVDTAAPTSKSLKDPDIQKEIARLINNASVPAPDADTLYMVHFPAGVSISMEGNLSCQQFCAYHGTFKNNGKNVYYGVMPDFSGGCEACGGTNDKLKNTTIVTSHELIEAITDPAIGLANAQNDESFLAWYDDQGGEIGDVCQSEAGEVSGWMVQGEYSMKEGGCIVVGSGSDEGTGGSGGGGTGGGGTGGNGGGGTGGSGGGSACDHAVCAEGAALSASCDACTTKICQADSYCCSNEWDRQCVSEVKTICKQTCAGGGGSTPSCSHGVCQTGGPLLSSCGPCTAKVCQADPSCCSDQWTAACVQKSVTLCGKHCQ
ncbi:MAG: hypothetical protein QM820_31195 [Minicystis sp.]